MATDTAPTQQETTGADTSADHTEGANMTTFCVNENEEFEIDLSGEIRLYFLRYGLLPKHTKEDWTVVSHNNVGNGENFQELTQKPEEISKIQGINLENFEIVRTTLHSGYLYIIDQDLPRGGEEAKDLYHEYKIDINGQYQWVKYKEGNIGADIRLPEEDIEYAKHFTEIHKHTDRPYHKWICFSQVQWPWAYLQRMIREESLRQERMVEVHLEAFPDAQRGHSLPYNEIQVCFDSHNEHCSRWIEKVLKDIDAYQNPKEEGSSPPEKMRDLFITLPDPIGCVFDITMATNAEIINHRANIEAMRTGREPDGIAYKMIRQQEQDPYTDNTLQHVDMFTLAQTSYHLVFGSQEMQQQFGNEYSITRTITEFRVGPVSRTTNHTQDGADKEKLENVLGVIERQERRALIRNLQSDLCLYINHDYYLGGPAFLHHQDGTPANKLEGKASFLLPCEVLVINPRDIDRTLDLADAFPEEDELHLPCIECVIDQIQERDDFPIYQIFHEEIEFTEDVLNENWEDIVNKLGGYINSILNIYSESNIKTTFRGSVTSRMEILFTYVRVDTRGPGGSIPIADFREENLQQALRREANARGVARIEIDQFDPRTGLGTVQTHEYSGTKALRRLINDGDNLNIISRTQNVGTLASVNVITIRRVNIWTERLVTSPAFSGTLSLLQIFNWGHTVNVFNQNPSLYNGISLMGTTLDLASVTTQFARSMVTGGAARSTLGLISGATGIAGGGITVMMSAWNSAIGFREQDTDSAIAYAGAAAAFTVSTTAAAVATGTITASAGVLAWAGPAAWITGAIAIGLYVLAIYLRDTNLESFFKNYTFGTHRTIPLNGRKAWEYNRDLFEARMTEISLNSRNHELFNNIRDLNRRERDQRIDQIQDLRNNSDVSNLDRSGREHFGTDFNTLDSFGDELAMLVNLIVFNNINITASNRPGSLFDFTIINPVNDRPWSTVSFSTEFEATIQFAHLLSDKDQIDYKVLLGPNRGRDQNQIIQTTLREEINITPKEGNTTEATISFRIPDEELQIANQDNWTLIFLFRISLGGSQYFPKKFNEELSEEKYIYTTVPIDASISPAQGGLLNRVLTLNQEQGQIRVGTLSGIQSGQI